MRVLAVVHQPDAGPGVFAEAVDAKGHELLEWAPPEGPAPDLEDVQAVMTFGGAVHADQEERHPWLREEKALLRRLLDDGAPLLGVCLGSQLLAEAAGARARRAAEPEIGWREVELLPDAAGDPLLGGLPDRLETFQWHSYEAPLPAGGQALARSPVCLQAFRVGISAWGVQFHAEVTPGSLEAWLDGWERDEDAVRSGLDPEELRAEGRAKIAAWNELGRELAGRFLETAERAATWA